MLADNVLDKNLGSQSFYFFQLVSIQVRFSPALLSGKRLSSELFAPAWC
jgi:hypothetical protein